MFGQKVKGLRQGASAALALALLVAPAAQAATPLPGPALGLWGQPGVVLVPTGQAHRPGAASVGAGMMLWEGGTLPTANLSVGLFEGLELGLNYGVPQAGGPPGLGGHARYQLVRPSRDNPTALALGVSLIGANLANGAMEGPQAFLVATRDVNLNWGGSLRTLGSASLGAMGLPGEGARMVAAVELPLAEWGGWGLEALGPVGTRAATVNAVVHYRPFPGWDLRLASVARPGGALWDREWAAGLSAHFGSLWPPTLSLLPGASQVQALAAASPAPLALVVVPTPLPLANPSPQAWPSLSPSLVVESPSVLEGSPSPTAPPSPRPLALASAAPAPTPPVGVATSVPGGVPVLPRPGLPGWALAPAPANPTLPPVSSPAPRPLGGLNGRLEGPGPWTGASVQLTGPGGAVALSPGFDGRFQARALPAGTYRLRAWAPQHQVAEREVVLAPGAPTELRVPLVLKSGAMPLAAWPTPAPRPVGSPAPVRSMAPSPPPLRAKPGVLSGVVLGPGGRPLRGAKVAIEGQELAILTLTGPDGSFVAADLPRGRYALTVSSQGLATQRLSATLGPAGAAPLRVALASGR